MENFNLPVGEVSRGSGMSESSLAKKVFGLIEGCCVLCVSHDTRTRQRMCRGRSWVRRTTEPSSPAISRTA